MYYLFRILRKKHHVFLGLAHPSPCTDALPPYRAKLMYPSFDRSDVMRGSSKRHPPMQRSIDGKVVNNTNNTIRLDYSSLTILL